MAVLGRRSVSKICESGILIVTVEVPDKHSGGTRPNESGQHQLVNTGSATPTISVKADSRVRRGASQIRPQQLPGIWSRPTKGVNGYVIKGTNAAEVGYLISPLLANYRQPAFNCGGTAVPGGHGLTARMNTPSANSPRMKSATLLSGIMPTSTRARRSGTSSTRQPVRR